MAAAPIPFSTTDNAVATLASGINASVLSIPLESGDGAAFPQPYSGVTTSGGTSTTLNCTGISAAIGGSGQVGNLIWNRTDGSFAVITAVNTDSLTTTRLLGGTDQTWASGDAWAIDAFVATIEVVNTNAYGVQSTAQYEEVLITGRSTDTLTVPTGGRGYGGTVANTFSSGDSVFLHVTSPIVEGIKDIISVLGVQVNTNQTNIANLITDLASTTNAKGASLIGIEDAGGNYTGTTVEAALTEIDTRLDAAVTLSQIGFYGDGSDGAVTWSSSTDLNPANEFEYTTATLNGSQTLGVTAVNDPLVIKCSGNVTINGTVELNGKGGAGGAGGASGGNGGTGTAGQALYTSYTNGAGVLGTSGTNTGGGGGGGSSIVNSGTAGSNASAGTGAGGAAGTKLDANKLAFLANLKRGVCCGGGGAGGGGGSGGGGAGGAGGAGGGALVWMVGGNLTLGASSVIRANGVNGSNGGASNGGGGGGGGGGSILILVAGSITNSGVTLSASGGSAGTPDNNGGAGGGGGTGQAIIYSLSTGTLITA